MSRVGRKEIALPQGVTVDVADRLVKVKGPKGELSYKLLPGLGVDVENSVLHVRQSASGRNASAFWGLTRSLINNMVVGVSEGYRRQLELVGTGYRADVQGNKLVLQLGYASPIEYPLPKSVACKVDGNTISFESIDKQAIGQVAAEVRKFRPPEPYKGKGVRFKGEQVRHKAGKTAAK